MQAKSCCNPNDFAQTNDSLRGRMNVHIKAAEEEPKAEAQGAKL